MSYFFTIQVRFADTDAQGHVFFGNYFTYFDEAVSGLLRIMGWSYDMMRERGFDLVYAHAECDYQRPAVFEEVLHVYPKIVHIGTTSLVFECVAHRGASDEVVAQGKLAMVMRDVKSGAKIPVPDSFRAAVRDFPGRLSTPRLRHRS